MIDPTNIADPFVIFTRLALFSIVVGPIGLIVFVVVRWATRLRQAAERFAERSAAPLTEAENEAAVARLLAGRKSSLRS